MFFIPSTLAPSAPCGLLDVSAGATQKPWRISYYHNNSYYHSKSYYHNNCVGRTTLPQLQGTLVSGNPTRPKNKNMTENLRPCVISLTTPAVKRALTSSLQASVSAISLLNSAIFSLSLRRQKRHHNKNRRNKRRTATSVLSFLQCTCARLQLRA